MFILKFEEMLKIIVIMGFFFKLFLVSYDVNYSVRLNCVYYILWILKVFLVSVLRILNIDYMIDMKCNMRYDNI